MRGFPLWNEGLVDIVVVVEFPMVSGIPESMGYLLLRNRTYTQAVLTGSQKQAPTH